MSVINIEQAAAYLNLDVDEAGEAFRMTVEAVNDRIEDFCRRQFNLEKHTEYHDIPSAGIGELFVKNPPIVALHSLVDDANTDIISGRSNRSITTTANVELLPAEDPVNIRLVDDEDTITAGDLTVKIVYTGGYEQQDMPRELVLAACEFVAAKWEGPERIARARQNVDGEDITWRQGDPEAPDIPVEVARELRRYRRPLI